MLQKGFLFGKRYSIFMVYIVLKKVCFQKVFLIVFPYSGECEKEEGYGDSRTVLVAVRGVIAVAAIA